MPKHVEFALVGSMNPDEGSLRPQLLDRFGLVVAVRDDNDRATRRAILQAVLAFETHQSDPTAPFMVETRKADEALAAKLDKARQDYPGVKERNG